MINIKQYQGSSNQQRIVIAVLKSLKVPDHSFSVYEQNRDTGYPGLAVDYTIVDINLSEKLAKKVGSALVNLGFSLNQ